MFCRTDKLLTFEERLDKIFEKKSFKSYEKLIREYYVFDHIAVFFKVMNDYDEYDKDKKFYINVLKTLDIETLDRLRNIKVFKKYTPETMRNNIQIVRCIDGNLIRVNFKIFKDSKNNYEYDCLINKKLDEISFPILPEWHVESLYHECEIKLIKYHCCIKYPLRYKRYGIISFHLVSKSSNMKVGDARFFMSAIEELAFSGHDRIILFDKLSQTNIINILQTCSAEENFFLLIGTYLSKYGYDSKIIDCYKTIREINYEDKPYLMMNCFLECFGRIDNISQQSFMFLLNGSLEYDNIDHFKTLLNYVKYSSESESSKSEYSELIDIFGILDYGFKHIVYYNKSYTILKYIVEDYDYDFTYENCKVVRFAAAYHKHELCSCLLELCYKLDSDDEEHVRDIINKDHVQIYHANKIKEMKVANSLKKREIKEAKENANIIAAAIYSIRNK